MNNELCCCGVVRESSRVPTGEADKRGCHLKDGCLVWLSFSEASIDCWWGGVPPALLETVVLLLCLRLDPYPMV